MVKFYTKEDLFKQMNKASKAKRKAEKIAEMINEYEGEFYSSETDTVGVLERYFAYHKDMDAESYWYSSHSTC